MSSLSLAHGSLVKAVSELEAAIEEAPSYSVDSLRFLKTELKDLTRRIENIRRVVGTTVETVGS